jgi:WD40 repeat protein
LWSHEFVQGLDRTLQWAKPTLVTAFRGPKNAKNAEPSTIHFAKTPDEYVLQADEFMHLFVKQPNEDRTDRMFSWTDAAPESFAAWAIPSSPRIVFDPRGRWIIADGNNHTVVLDRTTKEVRQPLPIIPNASWVSSDNGEFVMQIGKQQAVLWRTTDWAVVETWKSQSSTTQMRTAFWPGHDQFFLSRDGMIECRSRKTGKLIYQWNSPRPINDLQITPNGRYLIGSGSGLHVWDLTLCEE